MAQSSSAGMYPRVGLHSAATTECERDPPGQSQHVGAHSDESVQDAPVGLPPLVVGLMTQSW